jgi:acylphosphatase
MEIRQAHVWVSGRVQGVFFRYYTQEEATGRGLKGWVRNLPDGRVEAVLQGDQAALERMIQWCRQGPPSSRVDGVEVRWEDPDPGMADFRIRYF